MEWVPGGCWFDALGSDPPPPAYQRIRAARETAGALEYLHDALIGIIHGDIKSLNMLRASDGSSKVRCYAAPLPSLRCIHYRLQVCDFGGAVQVLATAATSCSGSPGMQTTRPWSAPELFTGSPKSFATDMYAFGVFMWELLTCEKPFHGVSSDLIDAQVTRGVRPRIPSPLPEGFPPAYEQLLLRCWSPNAQQRPTAREAHGILLLIDATARPSAPLQLFDRTSTLAPASLHRCILTAMQAQPGQPNARLASMLAAMVSHAAAFVSSSPKAQHIVQQYKLTAVEAQAVCLYTLDATSHGGLREESVYYVYNAALRLGQAEAVELWSSFSFLFCNALEKLPSVAVTVFRGLDVPLTQLSHLYRKGSTVWLNAVTSTTTDKAGTLLQFGTGASGRPGTLLQIIAVDAKDIQVFSPFPENELAIPPNSCHTVLTVLESAEVRCLLRCFQRTLSLSLMSVRPCVCCRYKRSRNSEAFQPALI